MLRCGEETGNIVFVNCRCSSKAVNLKHHCCLRTCPDCAKLRKRKLRNKYLPYLSKIYQDRKNYIYFLTISPRNYDSLEDGLKKIRKNFNKFIRHNYIKERVKGGLYVIESKQSNGKWNIHIHAIVYGRWIDNKIRKEKDSKLVSLWKKSSKEDVNIHISRQGSTLFSLNYMLKYISANKDDFNTPLDMAKYILSTRKMKLISTFGMFFKAKFEIIKPVCPHCNMQIYFVFDFEVMNIYRDALNRPPDPPDLNHWIP
jgi:hypothetical protein